MSQTIASRIEGAALTLLKQIADERGAVLHMLRADEAAFAGFGEIYFSEILPGVVKAWKRHRKSTQQLAVPRGRIRLVLFDDRARSSSAGTTEEWIVGRPDRYFRVRIPPLLWYGFQGLGTEPSLVANCIDYPHDPDESESLPPEEGPVDFRWIDPDG